MTKTCNRCEEVLPLDAFYRMKSARDGRQSCCITCRKRYDRENAEQIAARGREYRIRKGLTGGTRPPRRRSSPIPGTSPAQLRKLRQYGLTHGHFEWLLVSQAYRCAICNEQTDLCIDHDHETGVVRGLLCARCNAGLGMFLDDPQRLTGAIEYLAALRDCRATTDDGFAARFGGVRCRL